MDSENEPVGQSQISVPKSRTMARTTKSAAITSRRVARSESLDRRSPVMGKVSGDNDLRPEMQSGGGLHRILLGKIEFGVEALGTLVGWSCQLHSPFPALRKRSTGFGRNRTGGLCQQPLHQGGKADPLTTGHLLGPMENFRIHGERHSCVHMHTHS